MSRGIVHTVCAVLLVCLPAIAAFAATVELEAENFADSFGDVCQVIKVPYVAPVQQHDNMAKEIVGKADFDIKSASDGAFIGIPNGPGDKQDVAGGGWVKYEFNVPDNARWHVWGRVIAPTRGDNSLYWALDEDDGDVDSMNDDVNNIWDFFEDVGFANELTTDWLWFPISSRTGPFGANELKQLGNNRTGMQLSAGAHTLHIVHREDGVFLDWFLFTTDGGLDPNRNGQTSRAVRATDKMATVWGVVKSRY